jgi:hypothetical protein
MLGDDSPLGLISRHFDTIEILRNGKSSSAIGLYDQDNPRLCESVNFPLVFIEKLGLKPRGSSTAFE